MSIALVGAPGAGKTTIGELLAAELNLGFTCVDTEIENRAGQPITEIFTEHGEQYFRDMERRETLEQLGRENRVIALGGGAIMDPEIRAALAGHDVIWLEVSIRSASRRIGLNTARPLLIGDVRGRLIKLLRERTPLYESVATQRINTDDREPAELVLELAATRRPQ